VSNAPRGHLLHDDLTPAWLDHIAVTRCLNGHDVGRPLHHAERLAVARHVRHRGDGAGTLAALLGCNADAARTILKEATACSD
jgi:hypothetical protein